MREDGALSIDDAMDHHQNGGLSLEMILVECSTPNRMCWCRPAAATADAVKDLFVDWRGLDGRRSVNGRVEMV